MTDYHQKLLDHFLNPRNVGDIPNPDGFGKAFNPVNQYETDIYLQVREGRISDIKFKSFGCVVTIAAASALTTQLKGKTLEEIFSNKQPLNLLFIIIQNELEVVPPENWHCPPAAAQAFLLACHDYYKKIHDEHHVIQIVTLLKEVQSYFEKRLKEQNAQ